MGRFDKVSLLRRGAFAFLGLLLSAPLLRTAQGQIPPDETWRTLETVHLRVTYPDGLLDLAQRAGERGEVAWEQLSTRFVEAPEGKVDILITDHADISNGFAQAWPSNRIVVFAPPPMNGSGLGYMDEWLELVIIHELAHVFHQDLAKGIGGGLRRVLGRAPIRWPFYPGLATPGWTVEGIATYFESALTGAGRVKGTFHEMVLRTAVMDGAMESIDQTSGDSEVWPGGQRDYVFGSLFLEHLAGRYGEEAVADFVETVAGQWIPFRMNSAARAAFGTSFSESWEAWESELAVRYETLADSLASWAPLTVGERLTNEGYYALNPAPSPSGNEVLFARQDGRSDTQLRLLDPETGRSRKLARTNRLATSSWTPEGHGVFAQTEYVDSYRIRGDLYRIAPGGEEKALTRGMRLDDPSVSPSGGQVVAVQEGAGTNRLVLVDLPEGGISPLHDFDPMVHWAHPAWSPNGRWIAAARWRPGAYYDLVLLDREGALVQEITGDRAVDTAPTWSPDGRWLLWVSDRSGIPNLHAVEVQPESGQPGSRLQVTNLLGGAGFPAVDRQGKWIYYSSYHADGWHLARIPFDPTSWFPPLPLDPAFVGGGDVARYERRIAASQQEYAPLPTLAPTYWSPAIRWGDEVGTVQVLEPGFGVSTSGRDLVGRHQYTVRATYSAGAGGFEGGAAYSYAGLGNPTLDFSLLQSLDGEGPLPAPDDSGDLLYVVERERSTGLGATFLRRRSRTIATASLFGSHVWENRTLLEANLKESDRFRLLRPDTRLGEARITLGFATARRFPRSISAEDGVGIHLRGRARRNLALADSLRGLPGEDRGFRDVAGQVALYKGIGPGGFGNHVIALRVSGGVAKGPGADQYHFEVGGSSGEGGAFDYFELGQSLLFPVRGYPTARRFGRSAWSASAEYRFPILQVNRGWGLFPLHLDWLGGALFADAGNAWGPELGLTGYDNPHRRPLASVGGEVSARIFPFWYGTLDLRFGVGVPLVESGGPQAYLRIGPSF
jgi:Tol biopolymer transport system component